MVNELMTREMVYPLVNGEEMRLTPQMVKEYLVTGRKEHVTTQELMYFMHECKARKMNPFLRECWLIKYSPTDNAQIVESIHHKRNKARRHPDCCGWKKGILYMHKGEVCESPHPFMPEGGVLLGGYFQATPKGWSEPFRHEVSLASCVKRKRDGSFTAFWQPDKQPQQVMKVAESQGLSALWGDIVGSGMIPEEVPDADPADVPTAAPTVDIYGKQPDLSPSPGGDRPENSLSEGQSFTGKDKNAENPPIDPFHDRFDPAAQQDEVVPNWWENELNWKNRKQMPMLMLVLLGRGQALVPFELVNPDGSTLPVDEQYGELMRNLSKQNPGAVLSLDKASDAKRTDVRSKLMTVLGLDVGVANELVFGDIAAFVNAHPPVPGTDATPVDDPESEPENDPFPDPVVHDRPDPEKTSPEWALPPIPTNLSDQRLLVAQNISENFSEEQIRQAFESFGITEWPTLLADLATLLDRCRDIAEEKF